MKELCFFTNVSGEQWAAWVQAIGSVVAILVAVWVSRKQNHDALRLQERLRVEQQLHVYDAFRAILDSAISEYSDALDALKGQDPDAWFKDTNADGLYPEFHNAVKQISVVEMPSYESAKSLLKIRDLLESAASNVKTSLEHEDKKGSDYTTCVRYLQENVEQLVVVNQGLSVELSAARLKLA